MATNSTEKTYVLDTTTLIMDPEVIYRVGGVGDEVVIPMAVIKEIDGLKKSQYELKARAAKAIGRELAMLGEYLDLKEGGQLRNGAILRIETRYEKVDALDSEADNKVVGTAVRLMKEGRNVVLLSADYNMLTAARGYGVKAEFGVGGGDGETRPLKEEFAAGCAEPVGSTDCFPWIRTSDTQGGNEKMPHEKMKPQRITLLVVFGLLLMIALVFLSGNDTIAIGAAVVGGLLFIALLIWGITHPSAFDFDGSKVDVIGDPWDERSAISHGTYLGQSVDTASGSADLMKD